MASVPARIALALLAGIALAGCASLSGGAGTPVPTDKVTIPGAWVFEPKVAQVKVGATLTFQNEGGQTHSITFDDGSFDQTLAPGTSLVHTFTTAGTYSYHCKFHPPDMKGTVVVTQ